MEKTTYYKILYFLRNFPAWIPLLIVFVILVWLYKITADMAYKEWAGLVLASWFTALGIQRSLPSEPAIPQTNIENQTNTTKVDADTLETQTMDNANIKADNVSIKDDEQNRTA